MALAVSPHDAAGPPEDVRRVLACVEQLLPFLQHPLEAGVGHHPQAGAPPDIPPVTHDGGVIHADHTLGAVNFLTPLAADEVTGAGHQGTGPAVHLQRLGETVGRR